MYQYDRCARESVLQKSLVNLQYPGFWNLSRIPVPRKSTIRKLYFKICTILYAGSLLWCAWPLQLLPPIVNLLFLQQSCAVGTVGLPCADLPGNQLPVCTCYQYSAQFLCGNRWCKQCRCPGQRIKLSGNTGTDKICCI